MAVLSSSAIIPRWEWRMFSPSLTTMEDKVGASAKVAARDSSEIYILDLAGTQNAKIRDNIFDVKVLQKVDAHGLELWEPVFKTKFPLDRTAVISAFRYWNLTPKAKDESYSADQFIEELITPEPTLRVARVSKLRRGFQYSGCIAEFVHLTVNTQRLESFSLEHEEPARILGALRELGIDSRTNTNYQVGLKRALSLDAKTSFDTELCHGK